MRIQSRHTRKCVALNKRAKKTRLRNNNFSYYLIKKKECSSEHSFFYFLFFYKLYDLFKLSFSNCSALPLTARGTTVSLLVFKI